MLKKSISLIVSFALLLIIALPHNASAKVIWNGAELKKGQIGNLTILKQTALYKLEGTTKKVTRTLNPGEVYRIYTFLPGKLGVGAGYYIDRDSRIKYQTPSKEKLQALGVKITKNKYQGVLDYPQVTNLISKTAQDKINETFKKHIRNSYKYYQMAEESEAELRQEYLNEHGYPVPEDEESGYNLEHSVSYEVKYNENNQLSILIYDYEYEGGAHGLTGVTSYNFNVLTGQQLYLGTVTKGTTGLSKVKKYAITDLINRANRGENLVPEWIKQMGMDNSRAFYFTPGGVVIIFGSYEVGPYSSGMPEVKVPAKVYQ